MFYVVAEKNADLLYKLQTTTLWNRSFTNQNRPQYIYIYHLVTWSLIPVTLKSAVLYRRNPLKIFFDSGIIGKTFSYQNWLQMFKKVIVNCRKIEREWKVSWSKLRSFRKDFLETCSLTLSWSNNTSYQMSNLGCITHNF